MEKEKPGDYQDGVMKEDSAWINSARVSHSPAVLVNNIPIKVTKN